jgi:hypothetical protein
MVGMTAGLAVMTGLGTVQFAELVSDLPAFSFDPEVQAQIQAASTEAGLRVFKDFFRYAALTMALALPLVLLMTRRRPAAEPAVVSQDQPARKAG